MTESQRGYSPRVFSWLALRLLVCVQERPKDLDQTKSHWNDSVALDGR